MTPPPSQKTIAKARVTYASGHHRTFACTTMAEIKRIGDLHNITHGRVVDYLTADDQLVHRMAPRVAPLRGMCSLQAALEPVAAAEPKCRHCFLVLRRIGQGFGFGGDGLFCSHACGYAYAVNSIEDEDRPHAVMTAAEVAARRPLTVAELNAWPHGALHNYATGEYIRPATRDELFDSQGTRGNQIRVEGVTCYVVRRPQ